VWVPGGGDQVGASYNRRFPFFSRRFFPEFGCVAAKGRARQIPVRRLSAMRKTKTKKQTETFSLRMEPELRAKIEVAARADRRPPTHLIRGILLDWLDKQPATTTRPEHRP
jgi:hypothetical protein